MKLQTRGRHLEIPIIGYKLAEVRLAIDRFVELHFRNENDGECSLQLEDAITVTRGKQETVLDGSKPGASFAPKSLNDLVEILGYTVVDALAQDDGTIRLELSYNVCLSVTPQSGHEGWHMTLRPRRDSAEVHLHGATGHLIK